MLLINNFLLNIFYINISFLNYKINKQVSNEHRKQIINFLIDKFIAKSNKLLNKQIYSVNNKLLYK